MKRYKPAQRYPRTDLAEIVTTHLHADWQRPIAAHSIAAFDTIRDRIEASTQPLIITPAVARVIARVTWLVLFLIRWC